MKDILIFSIIIPKDHPGIGIRLDKGVGEALKQQDPSLSRVRLQALIEQGKLLFNNQPVLSPKTALREGTYTLEIPSVEKSCLKPQDIPFEIVFEDEDLIVINKPSGLTVHPGAGQHDGTLVNALLHAFGEKLSGIGGVRRPGIVHRLDKETSGLMVVAKNDFAHQKLSEQFADHTLARTYICFVYGKLAPVKGTVSTFIARHAVNRQKMAVTKSEQRGKRAITHYKVLKTFQNFDNALQFISMVECKLETGRTHQIRVHMNHIGHPLVGDPVYGKKTIPECWKKKVGDFKRQALHAKEIEFLHPRTGALVTFTSEFPQDMRDLLEALSGEIH